jgi:hypothetical protein
MNELFFDTLAQGWPKCGPQGKYLRTWREEFAALGHPNSSINL